MIELMDIAGAADRVVRSNSGGKLMTTHLMEEAEEQCQRVAVMSAGEIRAEGSPGELRAALGASGGTLEDVFVSLTTDAQAQGGEFHDIGRTRRTARRLG